MIPTVLHSAATDIRLTLAKLFELGANDLTPAEEIACDGIKERATDVADALDTLGAGTAPTAQTGPIEPEAAFMSSSQSELQTALTSVDSLGPTDLGTQWSDFETMVSRVQALDNFIARAAQR